MRILWLEPDCNGLSRKEAGICKGAKWVMSCRRQSRGFSATRALFIFGGGVEGRAAYAHTLAGGATVIAFPVAPRTKLGGLIGALPKHNQRVRKACKS